MQRLTSAPALLRSLAPSLAALAVAASAHAGEADDGLLPEAGVLLDRYVEVTGGAQAHLALTNRVKVGKLSVDMAGHVFDAVVTEHAQAPDKTHILVDGEFFSQVTVCNGRDAWEWSPGHRDGARDASEDPGHTRLLVGSKRAQMLQKARFHGALHWREHFASAETVGVADVKGAPAYEVRLVTKSGEQYSQFYDEASGLLVKRVRTTESDGGALDMEVFLGDYRELDGVRLPTRVEAHLTSESYGVGTQIWSYTKIEHDVEIPPSLFRMPEGLRDHRHTESTAKSHS